MSSWLVEIENMAEYLDLLCFFLHIALKEMGLSIPRLAFQSVDE